MLFGEGPQIKNIAADLNKLFRQGSLLNQSGQTVEGDSTADQGTSDLLAARDPVIQEISVGMSGEQSARYTVSGTPPLSLPNSLGKPLKAWSVDLLPYQEGTGDPSPTNIRPVHGTDKITIVTAGKNLYNSATFQTITRHGVTCTNNGDGSFTLNGTAALDIYFDVFKPQFSPAIGGTPLPNANYRMSGCPSGGGIETYYLYIIPNYHDDYGSGVSFTGQVNGGSIFVKNGFTCNNLVFRPQICLASAPNPTEFVPYLAPSQTVLTLPQTVYTGTIGSEGGESRWGEVDLGSLNWTQGSFAGVVGYYTQAPSNIKPVANGQAFNGQAETLSIIRFNAIGTKQYAISLRDLGLFYVNSDVVPSGKLIYELNTPTTFAVTTPTIPTPTGTATTWATAEDGTVESMEVTYVGKA